MSDKDDFLSEQLEGESYSQTRSDARRYLTDMAKRRSQFATVVFLLLAIGLFLLCILISTRSQSIAGGRWHSISGTITDKINKRALVNENLGRSSASFKEFLPIVVVAYKIAGTEYQSECAAGDSSFLQDSIEASLQKWTVGQKIEVYYDVTDPSKIRLQPGYADTNNTVGILLCLLLLIAPGFLALLVYWRKGKEFDRNVSSGDLNKTTNATGQLVAKDNSQGFVSYSPLLDEHMPGYLVKELYKRPEKKGNKISWFAMILILASLGCTGWGMYKVKCNLDVFKMAADSFSWPVADGIVLAATVDSNAIEYYNKSTGDAHSVSAYCPGIDYWYKVGGKRYDAATFSIATRVNSQGGCDISIAKAIVKKYPPRSHIKVYYNPRDPSLSLLQPGIEPESFPGDGYFALLTGLWLLPIAMVYFYYFPDDMRSSTRVPTFPEVLFGIFVLVGVIVGMIFINWFVHLLLPAHGLIHL